MTSFSGKLCEARHNTITAVSWCMDCDDGLCSQCLEDHKVNKASKNHQTIPVSQYVEIGSVLSLINQDCEEHHQRLTFYCLDHYVTACALCVPEKHKQCTSIKPIDELARHAMTSTQLLDIEKGIRELDNFVDELTNHRQRNINTIKHQKRNISREIQFIRKQINTHLDSIESDLLNELGYILYKNISNIYNCLDNLKQNRAKIKSLGKTIHQIKETLSDVKVFLATKVLGEQVRKEQDLISTLCDQDESKEYLLELSTDPQLKHLLFDLKQFGMIQVVRKPYQTAGSWKQQRAQIPTVKDIEQTERVMLRKISLKGGPGIRDCVISMMVEWSLQITKQIRY